MNYKFVIYIRFQRNDPNDTPPVPSLPEIQDILVKLEDKPEVFRGSREWIGSVEVKNPERRKIRKND